MAFPTPAERVQAVRRFAAQGLRDREIGDELGLTKNAVEKIRRRNAIPPGKVIAIAPGVLETVRSLAAQGVGDRDIGRTVGMSRAAVQAARSRNGIEAGSPPVYRQHGTPSTYNRGCRCDACRATQRKYKRERRKRMAGKVVLFKFEHGVGGYGNWNCRCDVCAAAYSAMNSSYQKKNRDRLNEKLKERRQQDPEMVNGDNRKRYATTQAETLDRADRRGEVWTSHEMEIASRRDLSSHEVALLLGRTYAAVTTRRKLMKGYRPSPGEVRTHGLSGYNRDCRCEICREAKRADNSDFSGARAILQQKSLGDAKRRGYQWTGPELELAARDDLPVSEIAARLGRSYAAVTVIRHKIRTDPKTINVAGLARKETTR